MKIQHVRELRVGDEVYWNDPDGGTCSRMYHIAPPLISYTRRLTLKPNSNRIPNMKFIQYNIIPISVVLLATCLGYLSGHPIGGFTFGLVFTLVATILTHK